MGGAGLTVCRRGRRARCVVAGSRCGHQCGGQLCFCQRRPRCRGPACSSRHACSGRRRRTATRPDARTTPDRSAGRRARFQVSNRMLGVNQPFAERDAAEHDSQRALRRPKQFQEGGGAELVLAGQRQPLGQDVLRCAEFEGFEDRNPSSSFPQFDPRASSTGLIPVAPAAIVTTGARRPSSTAGSFSSPARLSRRIRHMAAKQRRESARTRHTAPAVHLSDPDRPYAPGRSPA